MGERGALLLPACCSAASSLLQVKDLAAAKFFLERELEDVRETMLDALARQDLDLMVCQDNLRQEERTAADLRRQLASLREELEAAQMDKVRGRLFCLLWLSGVGCCCCMVPCLLCTRRNGVLIGSALPCPAGEGSRGVCQQHPQHEPAGQGTQEEEGRARG